MSPEYVLNFLVDAVHGCSCTHCQKERQERLVQDMRREYGCNTPAEFIEARRVN